VEHVLKAMVSHIPLFVAQDRPKHLHGHRQEVLVLGSLKAVWRRRFSITKKRFVLQGIFRGGHDEIRK
jgi:hypothetical protein